MSRKPFEMGRASVGGFVNTRGPRAARTGKDVCLRSFKWEPCPEDRHRERIGGEWALARIEGALDKGLREPNA